MFMLLKERTGAWEEMHYKLETDEICEKVEPGHFAYITADLKAFIGGMDGDLYVELTAIKDVKPVSVEDMLDKSLIPDFDIENQEDFFGLYSYVSDNDVYLISGLNGRIYVVYKGNEFVGEYQSLDYVMDAIGGDEAPCVDDSL